MSDQSAIEFRDGVSGRRASVRGGPDVWEIAMVQRDYGDDREGLYQHFSWLDRSSVDHALAYADSHREEIDARLQENQRAAAGLA